MTLVGRSFLHASDLHLGVPSKINDGSLGLRNEDIAQIADEIWSAFDNLTQLAIKEKVLFVVLAGDIYNDADQQDKLQGKFRDALEELGKHGIQVFIIHGNHDPLGDDTRLRRRLPDNVKVFQKNDSEEFLGAQDGEEKIMVAGVSFGSSRVPENLAVQFKKFSQGDAKWRVGVLHTSLEGAEGHGDYARVTNMIFATHQWGIGLWGMSICGVIEISSDPGAGGRIAETFKECTSSHPSVIQRVRYW